MIVEKPNVKKLLAGGAASAVLFLGLSGWMASRGGVDSVPAFNYVMLALHPLFAWYVWRERHSNQIIVWRDGIQVIRKSTSSPLYSWHEIDSIAKNAVDGRAMICLRDGRAVKLFGALFFGSHRETDEFVDRLKRWRDGFCSSSRDNPSPSATVGNAD